MTQRTSNLVAVRSLVGLQALRPHHAKLWVNWRPTVLLRTLIRAPFIGKVTKSLILLIKRELERVKGIEPSSQAWEARILPLNHTRFRLG
jgi:hypothetical protein